MSLSWLCDGADGCYVVVIVVIVSHKCHVPFITLGFPSLKILLTDDAPTILKVVGRLLRSNGHSVETAVNGNQSLESLKKFYASNECDVLLTDLQMPVMDGIESTKRFRVWEEAQQCLLDAQGMPSLPPPHLIYRPPTNNSPSPHLANPPK